MPHQFAAIAFTDSVRALQEQKGSRGIYSRMDQGADYNQLLSDRETAFIGARDSFYMASVSETGWPYVQHRGGPVGFLKVLDESTIAFANFSGNRQYISAGNFQNNQRVALIMMDYAHSMRLKLLGEASVIAEDDEVLKQLDTPGYKARVEGGLLIKVRAYDWNCPKYIPARYSEAQVREALNPFNEEILRLKALLEKHGIVDDA